MKEALKALIHEMEYVLSCINEDKIPFDGDDFHEALRLGKEALSSPNGEAQPEQASPMSEPNRAIAYAASSKLHELGYRYLDGKWMQPKEPEQRSVSEHLEPVAKLQTSDVLLRCRRCWYSDKLTVQMEYTTPPQGIYYTPPQRKPLTRGQIREIEVDVSLNPSFDYITPAEQLCRAIEAAHGIKE